MLGAIAGSLAVPSLSRASGDNRQDKVARYWHTDGGAIQCELCPHRCRLSDGKTGRCRNRRNISGTLYALGYGKPCALHVDPIEKKPFYHVLPGSRAYSIGVAGCNLRCKNCQNYTISQKSPLETENVALSPDGAVDEARRNAAPVVAFTYTEPSVWVEYVIDTADAAHKAGLRTALVSSGYINPAAFRDCCKVLDFARFDLKSFSNRTYHDLNAGSLGPVLDTIINARTAGLWVEVIVLVVPGWNDSDAELRSLCRWVKEHAGSDTPLHFSRFFPMYRLSGGIPTPVETLRRARDIARAEGVRYVYIGNVAGEDGTTYCPHCGSVVVNRDGFSITANNLKAGACGNCATKIAGVWE